MRIISRPRRRKAGRGAAGHAAQPENGGLYRLIFEQARDSILLLELPPGKVPVIRDANPSALMLHGYSRGEIVGRPVTVLGASLRRGRLDRLNSGGSAVFEVRQSRKDGTPLVTEVTARNINFGARLYGILVERDVTRRRRVEEEGRLVSGRLMLAREAEKKRLAASLHDAIGAMQVGMSASLLLIEEEVRLGKTGRVFASLESARKLLREVTRSFKAACVESWPPALAVAGLEAVLRELLSGFAGRSKIKMLADIRLHEKDCPTQSPLAIVVYRLAQEMLRNAEKHSAAEKLEFSVVCESGWLTLSARDDGRGFDPAKAKNKRSSLGLKIMADMAGSTGGYFSVYSRPGGGTLVKAELPLRPEPVSSL